VEEVNLKLQAAVDDGDTLWTVEDLAKFMRKSPRWVFYALRLRSTDPGSIPHIRLGRTPRFDPGTIREWVHQGCPPADTYRNWNLSKERLNKRP